ncbi:MAG TPA: AMP-binding protein, partial [Solirubrobacterales bacterium]|nr:AMP-binding protein [Solirubrobacterales bacterium]
NGGTVVCMREQPSADAVAEAIAADGATTLWLTAGLFHEVVDRRPDCLAGVRHLLAGGDVLSPDHVRRALRSLPVDARLTNGYGPTETTTFALTHEMRPGDEVPANVPIGRPIAGTACVVLDRAGREAPVGVPGELAIGGDGVARGYRGDPSLTAARFVPDPERPGGRLYLTGDRVRRRPDGALEFSGRLDRQIKIRGFRIEPAEVERALREHPRLRDAAVVPYDREPGDTALAAYVVPRQDSGTLGAVELRDHVARRLPAAMVPSAWIPMPKLPLTANGKLDRAGLPAPGSEHLAREPGSQRPRTGAERQLVRCFEEVLGITGIGVDDDFFALGGHSLLAVSLFVELERIAGRRVPLATIFEASTPRALASRLGTEVEDPEWPNLVALKPSGNRPPLIVIAAGDGNIVGFAPLARRLSAEQPLYALQPSGLDGRRPLDRGIGAMADRYLEALRSLRPRGPYLLAGRCNGATVAFEMAQRLRAQGEDVPLLVALDSDPPPAGPPELEPGVAYDPMMEGAWLRARSRGEEVPDLGAPGGPRALAAWLRAPVGPDVSRYLHEAWRWREDLMRAWPDPLGADADALSHWGWDAGQYEMKLAPQLLCPRACEGCVTPGGYRWDAAMTAFWHGSPEPSVHPWSGGAWSEMEARLREPVGAGVNRYLLAAAQRRDLREAFPDPCGADAPSLIGWAWEHGVDEGLAPGLLPLPAWRLPLSQRLERMLDVPRQRLADARKASLRGVSALAEESHARALELVERRLSRPLPGARERIERRVVAAARDARATYRADPWPGEVVLVTSTEFVQKPTYLAWSERADRVKRRDLPVGHVEMLRDPGAALLARCLEQCAAEALGD